MTIFQRKKIQEELERQNAKVDAGADKALGKLQNTKWTGAILLAAGAVVILIIWMLA